MKPVTNVQAALVNESASYIERNVIKITKISGVPGVEFIKTYPDLFNYKTRRVLPLIEAELPPNKRRSFIGIGFNLYEHVNYIRFFSTYTLFPLDKGDNVELLFEDGESFKYNFEWNKTNLYSTASNIFPITDEALKFMAENRVTGWSITNTEKNATMVGGFIPQEDNKQYSSEKMGMEIFKAMAKEVLKEKMKWLDIKKK